MEIKKVNPWKWQDNFGFSQAIEFSGHSRVLTCSGQTSVNADGEPLHDGDMGAQLAQALDNVEAVLSKAGMTLSNVVHLNLYTPDIDSFFEHYGVAAERLAKANCQPAMTLIGVSRLFIPTLLIEMEATAVT